ncbi:MAG TPA: hypothetical protein VIP11_00815 [Gemmatimonadaceae bacterium]
MRRIAQLTLFSVAAVTVACRGDKPAPSAMGEDLKRDLQLASATQNIKISADEIAPRAQKELALTPKAAPKGPKVIRSEKPTVKASTTPVQVAQIKTEIPQIQAIASAPAPSESPSPDAPPMARPAPVPMPTYPTAAPIPEGSGSSGGILAGVFGAVIRGGMVGDDDHCDPRAPQTRRPRGGRPVGGDIYTMPGTIGMGGSRIPVNPIGRRF